MRRFFTYGTLLGSALLIVSCLRPLTPEELLVRSAAMNRQLRSAGFAVTGHMGSTVKGARNISLREGILQDGGATLSFLFDSDAGEDRISAQIVVWQGVELYLKILSSTQAGSGTVSDSLGSGWWRIPLSAAPAAVVSPEPGLLRLQTEVVKVLADRGKEIVDGRSCRHLEVALDEAKLLSFLRRVATSRETKLHEQAILSQLQAMGARGELWIDVKTHQTRKIVWRTLTGLMFTFTIGHPDDAPPILPPAGAKPLPENTSPAALFQMFFTGGDAALPFDSLFFSPRSYE